MKHYIIITIAVSIIGFTQITGQNATQSDNQIDSKASEVSSSSQKKVTGIGGVFFKSKDPDKMRAWYRKHLGLITDDYGTLFEFRSTDDVEKKGYLQWSPFSEKTKYFEPSEKDFMINYRVEDIEGLLDELKEAGVTIVDTLASYDYGKFAHIMDLEGNKLELWEPVDSIFTNLYEGKTTH